MEQYAGLDVSLEATSVCVVDGTGRVVREAKVPSEPEALVAWFAGQDCAMVRIGLEAGPLSQWLFAGMAEAGLPVELLETRHVRAALKTMTIKTDREDARGIAHLMRMGWHRSVHCKSTSAQEVRAVLTARKLLQGKRHDIEMSLRGVLRGFGLKVGPTTPKTFEARIRELVEGNDTLTQIAEALLSARATLMRGFKSLESRLLAQARRGARTRLLMTTPGVGALTALTFAAAIDDPARFRSSRMVGGAFRPDADEVSVRGDGRERPHLEGGRSRRARRPLRGGERHPDPPREGLGAEELGARRRQARGHEKGESGAGAQAGGGAAPDAQDRPGLRSRKASRGGGQLIPLHPTRKGTHDAELGGAPDTGRRLRGPTVGTMDRSGR